MGTTATMTKQFLAFDLGAESGRALLGTLNGGRLALAEKHRFANPNGRMNGHLQWNLLQQWEELKTGLRKACAGGVRIDGIGVDTWGVDFGLIGKSGEVLGNPVCYRDGRTDGIIERAFRGIPRAELVAATGIQLMQFNTLFQLLAMQEQGSDILHAAETLLFMPDLFNYLFTGQRKSEISIASTSQMIDPQTRTWATKLVGRFGLNHRLLAELVPSGTVIGPLQKAVQNECGAGDIPVIAPAEHDTASAVAAVPADGDDWCYISSGTWSLMGVELPHPIINNKSSEYNYTNELGVGRTVRFLKNIMGLWLVQECRRQWAMDGKENTYAELTSLAGQSQAFSAVIDPNHQAFLAPGQMPEKIHRFCAETAQPKPATIGQTVRTCLEALALTYRKTIEGLEDILGRRINVIHIVGGGTQNELLNQMTADACGRKVVAGPIEATAIGNILVQAMALGLVRDLPTARKIVRDSFPVKTFTPQDSAAWDAAYVRYQSIIGR